MKKLSFLVLVTVSLAVSAFQVDKTEASGLYLDLPYLFTEIDSSRANLTFSQTFIQLEESEASILTGECAFRLKRRSVLRLGLTYPVMRRENDILDNVGDGFVRGIFRVRGDTLDVSGIFLRGDVRIPLGSKNMHPFSFGSLDGGAGVEIRTATPLFGLKLAATYNLVGERRKSSGFSHRNFLLMAGSIDFDLMKGMSFHFSGHLVKFRGGGNREIYILTLDQGLSADLLLTLSGSLEAGKVDDRIYDSAVSLALVYRFPKIERSQNGE